MIFKSKNRAFALFFIKDTLIMTKKMPAALAHALTAFTALAWGSSFIASKILLQSYSPTQVMLMRFVLAYAALWLCCPKTL